MFVDDEMRGRQRELAEGHARPAVARQSVSYQGRTWLTTTIQLGVYFLGEPTFSWGARIVDGQGPDVGSMNAMAYVLDFLGPDEDSPIIDRAVVTMSARSMTSRYLRFSFAFDGSAIHYNAALFAEE